MEKGKALQVSSKTSATGVNDEGAKNEEGKLVMNGFGANNLPCNNESIKKLPGTEIQIPLCSDRYCQTDDVSLEVKRSKTNRILLIALILLVTYYAATNFSVSGSEFFLSYLIKQSYPDYDSLSLPSDLPANSCICTESQSIFKSLSFDQCSKFDSLELTSEKLDYLTEFLNWKPMLNGVILPLQNIYSYQSCKYFIGVSEKSIYKFTLYQDYTLYINFYRITSFLLSPDYNYIALNDDSFILQLIDFENFKSFNLNQRNVRAASSLFVFSPDSKYLFYARDDVDQVFVYNTLTKKLIIQLNTHGDKVVNMKASKNLYHLIVKDNKNNIKVFNIENSNYKHLCWNEEMKKNMAADFPEIEELI